MVQLQIRDGDGSGAPLLANLCGSALPDSVTSSGNRLWIRFRPSQRQSQRGYDITYTSTSQGLSLALINFLRNTCTSFCLPLLVFLMIGAGAGCGGAIFNTRGSFTSPGFPGNLSRPTDCKWEVTVPLGMLIQIDFPGNVYGSVLIIYPHEVYITSAEREICQCISNV